MLFASVIGFAAGTGAVLTNTGRAQGSRSGLEKQAILPEVAYSRRGKPAWLDSPSPSSLQPP